MTARNLGGQFDKPIARTMSQKNWDSGQYPMFMTAEELANPETMSHGDVSDSGIGYDSVVRQKLRRSQGGPYSWSPADPEYNKDVSLYESIEKGGVRQPVRLAPANREKRWWESESVDTSKPMLLNGHHRVFSASDVQSKSGKTQWVPVEFTDETDY